MLLISIIMYLVMLYSNFSILFFFLSLYLMIMVITNSLRVFELLGIFIYKYSCRSDVIYCKYICGSQMIVLY